MAKFIPVSLRSKNNEKREGRKTVGKKEKQTKNLRNKNENKGTKKNCGRREEKKEKKWGWGKKTKTNPDCNNQL